MRTRTDPSIPDSALCTRCCPMQHAPRESVDTGYDSGDSTSVKRAAFETRCSVAGEKCSAHLGQVEQSCFLIAHDRVAHRELDRALF